MSYRFFIKALLVAWPLFFYPFLSSAKESAFVYGPGEYQWNIMHDGLTRSYYIHVPAGYSRQNPAPVVINMHGGAGNAKSQRLISQTDKASDKYGFIVVYPEGTNSGRKLVNPSGYTWNAGTCCGWAMKNGIDDVGFIGAVLDDLEKRFNIDKKRIFATGMSNGAMMSYRLACELSSRIVAIAPVAGPMGMTECSPSRPVSVIHFHGTDDEFAPYKGGRGPKSFSKTDFASVDETISFWLEKNGLKGTKPKTTNAGDAIGYSYGPSENGAEVELWVINGGGHTWPGGKFWILGESFSGKITQDISANDLMWAFFQRHRLQ